MSNLAAFLQAQGIRLNTDLGQHFLEDDAVLRSIVDAAEITPDDHIVEIGAGVGVLTKELVSRARFVTAIELDRSLIPLLHEYVTSNQLVLRSSDRSEEGQTIKPENHQTRKPPNLAVIEGNALEIPLPSEPYKIVANIPYHITSPLLRHAFLESVQHPKSMTLLIQKEVAEKICHAEDFGLLTILVRLFGEPRMVRSVPPQAFIPPPKVDSAVIHIACFPKPKADPATVEELFLLTKLAFGQKRKMLRNTIGSLDQGMARLEKAGIDAMRRPQTLSIEEWIRLAQTRNE